MINFVVKVNNQAGLVRIVNGRPVISWSFDATLVADTDAYGSIDETASIEQKNYNIRIGTSDVNWGNSLFTGNIKITGIVESSTRSWAYVGTSLERGLTYYGQILVKDVENESSDWHTFSFRFNELPNAIDVAITPSQPSVNDDLELSYIFSDLDDDAEVGSVIKWFKNGAHQRQFDNQTFINSQSLSYGDTWSSQVFPSDGFELGPSVDSNIVPIVAGVPASSTVNILPTTPNENDILKADYLFTSDQGAGLKEDKSRIRWYVNDILDADFNDQDFARPDVSVGDEVRVEIQPFDGVSFGDVMASATATIISSNFIVENIRIDGKLNPLNLLSLRPVISWDVVTPSGRSLEYVSIKIDTVSGGAGVYSATIQTKETRFTVPENILDKGTDYFVSIAVSDTQSFIDYKIDHFRTSGSRWSQKVSNSVGWTVETVMNTEGPEFDEGNYQTIRIQDGVKFSEVRIYVDRIGFLSEELKFSQVFDFDKFSIVTIVGKKSNIKVYVNREEAIDATGLFSQVSIDKKLEFGSFQAGIRVKYQSFYYTTDGAFHPGSSTKFNDIQFHQFAEFPGHNSLGLKGFTDDNQNKSVFAVNPNDENVGGSIYLTVPGDKKTFEAAARTFSPIVNVSKSVGDLFKVFSHARGASIFKSYLIKNYDHFIDFRLDGNVDPRSNGWEVVQNIGKDITTKKQGWIIDTTFESING